MYVKDCVCGNYGVTVTDSLSLYNIQKGRGPNWVTFSKASREY